MTTQIFKIGQIVRYGINPSMIAELLSSRKHFQGTLRTYYFGEKLNGGFITLEKTTISVARLSDLRLWEQHRCYRNERSKNVAANIAKLTGSA